MEWTLQIYGTPDQALALINTQRLIVHHCSTPEVRRGRSNVNQSISGHELIMYCPLTTCNDEPIPMGPFHELWFTQACQPKPLPTKI